MSNKVVSLKQRQKSGLLLWLVLFVVLLLGVLYMVVGQSKIRQIIVSGSDHYTRDEVIQMTGITSETTVLDLFMSRNRQYKNLPYIKEITIDYRSFNSIHIKVTEKTVISYIPYQNQFLALDKDGYIVGYEDEKRMELPSVTGLYFAAATLGEKLEVDEEVLNVMLDLYHLGNKYEVKLTSIDFANGDAGMIHCFSGNIQMIFGSSVDLDRKMKNAGEVLKKLDNTKSGTLDLQNNSDYYIFKEDIGADFYMKLGELYVGVDRDFIVKKIGPHREINVPLIGGIEIEAQEVNAELILEENAREVITQILNVMVFDQVPITGVNFVKGNLENIELISDSVVLRIGSTENIEAKLESGYLVLATVEGDAAGVIDLREEKESYIFEAVEE